MVTGSAIPVIGESCSSRKLKALFDLLLLSSGMRLPVPLALYTNRSEQLQSRIPLRKFGAKARRGYLDFRVGVSVRVHRDARLPNYDAIRDIRTIS